MQDIEIKDEIAIDANAASVWDAIKDPTQHASWHPFLTEIKGDHALGADRFCSVTIGGKPSHTRERCVVEEVGQRIIWRIDDDSSGFSRMVTDWKTGFSLSGRDDRTLVTAQSSFRPRNPLIRLMMPVVRRKFHQTQRAILEGLKQSTAAASQAEQ